jgi:hypothetical protein
VFQFREASKEGCMSDQQDCQRLDWESAELHPGVAGGFFLVVRGTAPTAMEVELRSLPIPIAPEDYHGVEVCGCSNGPVAQVETPWEAEASTEGWSGRVGFELIGATKREWFPPKTD